MKVLGLWHDFDPEALDTYPQFEHPIQVRFVNELTTEGECAEFFPEDKRLTASLIKQWRYIHEAESSCPVPRMFGDYGTPGPKSSPAIFDLDEEPFEMLSSSEQFIRYLQWPIRTHNPPDQRCRKSPYASHGRTWNRHCDPNVASA